MKIRHVLQFTIVVAAFAAGSLSILAQDAPADGRRGQGRGTFAGLDDKQRELLREAMQKDQEQIRVLDEKMRAAQRDLMNAALAENFDEKVVRQKAEAVSKISTDITVIRAKALSSIAPTLKPEQREQLANSPVGAAMLGGRMGGGPGFGGGRGPEGAPGAPGGGRRREAQ
jgi:Spy/CpxP family protein refolding chaperone